MPVPPMTRLWLLALWNSVSYAVCIKGVFVLTTECSSLSVTLMVTLRKFISLLISIYYFQNPFTTTHYMGTLLVFGGIRNLITITSSSRV